LKESKEIREDTTLIRWYDKMVERKGNCQEQNLKEMIVGLDRKIINKGQKERTFFRQKV